MMHFYWYIIIILIGTYNIGIFGGSWVVLLLIEYWFFEILIERN